VVIRYLYVVGIAVPPQEAQPELIVDANAVLADTNSRVFLPAKDLITCHSLTSIVNNVNH
jgi:hypothetical protein